MYSSRRIAMLFCILKKSQRSNIGHYLLSDAFTKSVEQLLLAPKCSPKSQTIADAKNGFWVETRK